MGLAPTEQLTNILLQPEEKIDLGRATLLLARLEYADLNIDACCERLDRLAADMGPRVEGLTPLAAIGELNRHLFEELGFHGNELDYYDPKNSFLNDVMERRTGIPITLSVVYLEVARRLALPLHGVGLPSHFLVKHRDARSETFVDPFHHGQILDRKGCQGLIDRIHGGRLLLRDIDFAAVTKRSIILRMLNNLRGIYLRGCLYRKALGVMDATLALTPDSVDDLKQRAWLHHQLGQNFQAARYIEKYLSIRGETADADQVKHWILEMRKATVMLN
jgi:regulator of sirC expression with transglutaminase-like and TPR domain